MEGVLGFLSRVKSRGRARVPARWLLRLALVAWKLARQLPLARHIRLHVSVDGHRMRIRPFSYDDLLTVSSDYESCLASILPPPGGIAVDAGAFIGRHTLEYARAVGPAGRVVAVEPLPANYRLLTHNVHINAYDWVTCVPCALGLDEGVAWLAFERETSTASTVRALPEGRPVPQWSLDHLLEQLGLERIDFLKIDVEGVEWSVLEGAKQILAASPRARLVIEVHAPPVAASGARCPVREWLADRGYAIQELRDGERLFYLAEISEAPAGLRSIHGCELTAGHAQ
ncbi:MAG: FkbM family methyltransferase [Pirellulales bacterium]